MRQGSGKRIGWFGWAVRLIGGTVLAVILLTAGAFAYFTLAIYPKMTAQQAADAQKAQAFAKLTGAARRLAIYDALVSQIDHNYYDQTFSGFDWPKMKREGRLQAAAAKDDTTLYLAVFFPMMQHFPVSHMGATPPPSPPVKASKGAPKKLTFSGAKDFGFQFVLLRRHGRVIPIVGQVWPQSAAAKAGIAPGWVIDSANLSENPQRAADQIRFKGTLTRLTPDQMHTLETVGKVPLVVPDSTPSTPAIEARRKAVQVTVAYHTNFTGPDASFIAKRLPSGVLYIRFDNFDKPTLQKLKNALRTAGPQGAVLDLRYNIGGLVQPFLSALLPGHMAVYKMRDAKGMHTISTALWTHPYRGPLAVLTGPASASAAELAASVLKSHHRALIIGRATNGSVLGCELFPLPDGGEVSVAIQDIETLDGKRLEGVGVSPDIEVYPSLDDVRQGRDPALDTAERQLLHPAKA